MFYFGFGLSNLRTIGPSDYRTVTPLLNYHQGTYTSLVRPTIAYASSIWSPSKKDSINKVEAVQRRAARFATGDYQCTSSVTAMLQQLQWQTLQSRQAYAQIVMMYRIVYSLVDIPAEYHPNRTTLRTRGHSLRFLVPLTRTTVYRNSFFSTSHTPLEPTTEKCGGRRHPRQLQGSAV
jgi:hypothetical protein